MDCMTPAISLANSGKLRWQCESTSITSRLHCMRGSSGLQHPAEQGFDLVARFVAAIFVTELDTDTLRAATLRDRCDPDDMANHLELYRIVDQAEQHENFIADFKT